MNKQLINPNENLSENKNKQSKETTQNKKTTISKKDLEAIQESTTALIDTLQEVYGMTKEEAENEFRNYRL